MKYRLLKYIKLTRNETFSIQCNQYLRYSPQYFLIVICLHWNKYHYLFRKKITQIMLKFVVSKRLQLRLYLRLWHPDGSCLLLVNEVCQFCVPLALGCDVVQVQGGGEHVTPQLLQLLTLLQQLLGRQVGFPAIRVIKGLVGSDGDDGVSWG